MTEWWLGALSAGWLGILTSISPCPLATNIAAMSYISREMNKPGRVFYSGLFYTLGRMVTYWVLGTLLVSSLLSMPLTSFVLQKYMNKIIGPLLIIAGMFLLELLSVSIQTGWFHRFTTRRNEAYSIWGAGTLGMVFALSFCPVSAALFFGSLIPLAVQFKSGLLFPTVYGLGTAFPVVLFAVLLAWGIQSMNAIFLRITRFEWWGRQITGVVFILTGIYLCLSHIFGLFSTLAT